LQNFYKKTRPFGLWGPLKETLDRETRIAMQKEHRNDILAVPFTYGWQISLFLWPMLLLLRNWAGFAVTFGIFCISLTGMYFLWYRNLPPAG
jgi:hypothetical protein